MKLRLLAASAASLLFSLAVLAFARGAADLASVPARVSLSAWEERHHAGSDADWQRAYDGLTFASSVSPLNADYDADLGRLMEWRAWRHPPGSAQHSQFRRAAARFYGEAVRRRPSWGFAWAHLAENRLLLGLADEDYRRALDNAIRLAPWEPGVQHKVARMGMASWRSLPESQREAVRATVRRALDLAVHSDEIVRLAAHYDWTEELRPLIGTDRQRNTFDFVNRQIDAR